MKMFGGLTKTSSRIAIGAALGLALGGFVFTASPVRAADLGGDCCADLEERVAELEATTVRKGNKKVSVTLSGWVVKSMNYWDDGDLDHFVVGDKDYDLGSRFALTGSAQIAPGWSAGYNLTVNVWATSFGTLSNQANDLGAPVGTDDTLELLTTGGNDYGAISTLYSYGYIKSDTLGTINIGHLSPASDNAAVLADISGTVIESNGVWFEGPAFFLSPSGGGGGIAGLPGLTWGDLLRCQGLGANIGLDCFGVAQDAVRYDSPTWGGFRFEASYGKNQLTGPVQTTINPYVTGSGTQFLDTSDSDFADIAVFYTGDWNSIKLSAAYSYTWIETAVGPSIAGSILGPTAPGNSNAPGANLATGTLTEANLHQVGASIMHKPSGLGIYGLYQFEETGGSNVIQTGGPNLTGIGGDPLAFVSVANEDTDAWYLKPFWRKAWSPIGATVLYGEYGQYNDQFRAGAINLCAAGFGAGTNVGNFCTGSNGPLAVAADFKQVYITGSEVQRWGLGVVQEIDSAAMHLWARWQHQEMDSLDLVGFSTNPLNECANGCRINQGFDDMDIYQVGGVIFF